MALPFFFEKGNSEAIEHMRRDRLSGTMLNLWLNSKGQEAMCGVSRWLSEATG
jgi:hypothetical protein